jgi:hypothetical protein
MVICETCFRKIILKNTFFRLLISIFMYFSFVHAAQANQWVLGLGYDGGGDKLGAARFPDNTTQTLRTNEGLEISIGRVFPLERVSQFEFVVTAGYKNGGPIGTGGEVTFTSWPVIAMGFFRPNDVHLGAGLAYQLSPRYITQGINTARTTHKFDNAVGMVAQIGWAPITQRYSFDLRYTSIKYQEQALPIKIDGSTIGVYASGRF